MNFAYRAAEKAIWRRRLFPALWPVIAILLKICSLSSREVSPATCGKLNALVLTGLEDSFISGRVAGQDLTDLASKWLRETVAFQEVRRTTSLGKISREEAPDITLVTYDWLLEHDHRPLRSVIHLVRQLRRLRSPAFVILPDGFRLKTTAMGSLIVAIAGGSQILLQDAIDSHTRFGTIRPTGPHFWTWPPSHLSTWSSNKPWLSREKLALIGSGGGGEYREWVARMIEPRLQSFGYQTRRTNNSLTWNSYIELHRRTRLVITTCKMQPEYLIGPRYYQERIPDWTVTGRVWEAFASGNLLITDANPILQNLGFLAGHHYLAIPSSSEPDWSGWHLPPDEALAMIAQEGHVHFRNLVEGLSPSVAN